jgi:hypothetical protein
MKRVHFFTSMLLASLAITGCSIQSKHENGEHKENVKIETPLGGMNVRTDDVQAKDTGMSVFPGATPVEKDSGSHDEKKANVNIDTPWFGVKVVALTFRSSEPQEKIWDYYKKDMGKYGRVLECRPGSPDLDLRKRDDEDLTCYDDDKKMRVQSYKREGKSIQLKVGTSNKQRIVALKPAENGSTEFSLVFVSTRGEKETL